MQELTSTVTAFQSMHNRYYWRNIMEHEVSLWGSIMVQIGFLGWIGSTIGLIFKGFTEENELVTKKALFWGIAIVVFYTIWIAGLRIA